MLGLVTYTMIVGFNMALSTTITKGMYYPFASGQMGATAIWLR